MRKEIELIDSHIHATGIDFLNYYTPRIPSTHSLKETISEISEGGISKAVIFPFPGTLYYNPTKILKFGSWEPSGLEDFPYQVENSSLLREIKIENADSFFFPFLAFDPKEKVLEQCEYLRLERQFFGIKIHTLATRSTPSDVDDRLLSIVEEKDIPIIFHTGKQENTKADLVVTFAKHHPNIRVGLAHLAGFDKAILEKVACLPNLYIDTSPLVSLCYFAQNKGLRERYLSSRIVELDYGDVIDVVLNLYSLIGSKLIWGTDAPFGSFSDKSGKLVVNFSYKDEVAILNKLLKAGYVDVVRQIAGQNIKEFIFGKQAI
ncbi:hypothetical protein C4578_01420 [Candidatus Microgenomates bacterium]|jgi:predicted TIM-barrel fold metal-dependent hydrolase|nr:MAG: hypothetical protein C4578_01420 [Candidatus Microgenomates bacterium]